LLLRKGWIIVHTTTVTRAAARGGFLSIALAAILWGTTGVTTKLLYHIAATNALSVGFFRLAFAVPVLLIVAWSRLGRRMLDVAPRDLLIMALAGAMQGTSQVCYFAAIADTGVAVATLITICAAPVLVALISLALAHERIARTTVLALGSALVGTALLVEGLPDAAPRAALTGVLLALAAAVSYAIVVLAGRALAGRHHPLQVAAVSILIGALFLLPIALLAGFVTSYPPGGWLLLVCLGVFPTALAYVLFQHGMRATPATVASVVTLLEPLTATVLAWVFFGERLGPWAAPGILLLFGALALLYRGAT
jgi:DME family drug/metabolite transporter